MAQTFDADELIDAARKATGVQRFDSESFREGLGVLLADANRVSLSGHGHSALPRRAHRRACHPAKTTAYLEQRPELLERPIERPLFVFGIPRTGTTLLSNLLAADPSRRSPLTWEIDDPVPPPTTATLVQRSTGARAAGAGTQASRGAA